MYLTNEQNLFRSFLIECSHFS